LRANGAVTHAGRGRLIPAGLARCKPTTGQAVELICTPCLATSPYMILNDILHHAQQLVREALSDGGYAIDATLGNGHDTLTLAEAVGADGHVFGFDVQRQAVAATRKRMQTAGVADRVTCVEAGHEHMNQHVPSNAIGHVDAVMFNLGYLPGSDKSVITAPTTTLRGLEHALHYLRPGGVLTVVKYVGHEGGRSEAAAVDAWAASLDQTVGHALSYQFINRGTAPPQLLAIERAASSTS